MTLVCHLPSASFPNKVILLPQYLISPANWPVLQLQQTELGLSNRRMRVCSPETPHHPPQESHIHSLLWVTPGQPTSSSVCPGSPAAVQGSTSRVGKGLFGTTIQAPSRPIPKSSHLYLSSASTLTQTLGNDGFTPHPVQQKCFL